MTERRGGVRFVRAAVAAALAVSLAACAGWVPGRQSYWDAKVKEMCEKDGGVTIYERVQVSKAQFERLGKTGGFAGVSPKALLRQDDVVNSERSEQVLREWNPRVTRVDHVVRRRDDDKVVARITRYSRVGGDIPSPAHESAFTCPTDAQLLPKIEEVYLVIGVRVDLFGGAGGANEGGGGGEVVSLASRVGARFG